MANVNFTHALKRFYPKLEPFSTTCENVSELIALLDDKYPGLRNYIVDEQGQLRKHVNIFIQQKLIKDRINLQDPIQPDDEIYIMQALSGG
ncbi:MAG: MoaD/ThiS family protein [Saprospiraceae bacterium]|nr:MoaD/ThiS family protein [Saprospiraceae bacterium]